MLTDPIKPGDVCVFISHQAAEMGLDRRNMTGAQCTVVELFPEYLVPIPELPGYVSAMNCRIQLADGKHARTHTSGLRKIEPPREDLRKVDWRDVLVWRPMRELA